MWVTVTYVLSRSRPSLSEPAWVKLHCGVANCVQQWDQLSGFVFRYVLPSRDGGCLRAACLGLAAICKMAAGHRHHMASFLIQRLVVAR